MHDTTSSNETVNGLQHVCVIADRGWIFEGYREYDVDDVVLRNAHVVRKWANGLGIGALADPGHKDDYTLDVLGTVMVPRTSIIAEFVLEW